MIKKIAIATSTILTLFTFLTGVALAGPQPPHLISVNPLQDTNEIGTNHTVTARVVHPDGAPQPGVLVSFEVFAGPNTGEMSDPGLGECSANDNCTTDANGLVSWTYTGSGGVGLDGVRACITDTDGTLRCVSARKDWVDTTAPSASCIETTNPHGNTTPPAGSTTLPGSKGGQNEDGFYELSGKDPEEGDVEIFVMDTGSGTIFGPFEPDTKIKYTQAPGATPTSKEIGSDNGQAGAVEVHITGTGDAEVFAVDAAGNQSDPVGCLVPPPPK